MPLVTYSGNLTDCRPVRSVNSLHPLSIWLCVDGWLFVYYLLWRELYLSYSRMKRTKNFNVFSFPLKVLKARHGEMTWERLVAKDSFSVESTGVCFSTLRQLSSLPDIRQHPQCLFLSTGAFYWIWAEKTPGPYWPCCNRELVLRFSLLTSWKLNSLLICDFNTEQKGISFQWNVEILLSKIQAAEPWLPCPPNKFIFYKKKMGKKWRMWKDSETLWGSGLVYISRKFKYK